MKSNEHYSPADRSKRNRDWLPGAVLSVVIGLFLIIVIKVLFFSNLPENKDALKPIVENEGEEKNLIIPKKVQKPKREAHKAEKVQNVAKMTSEKSQMLEAPLRRYGIKDKDLIAFYPFNRNSDDESGYENHGTVYGARLADDRFGNEDSAYLFIPRI
ncbi:MAG: hypothetical protein SRB2_00194 [Desulfobacteraceae bacterium Eth-SRB2]|nr:MAG: hypothetical protein SRB2_00194 [Desulfobacteraceae bacterium Eth-SRB2]